MTSSALSRSTRTHRKAFAWRGRVKGAGLGRSSRPLTPVPPHSKLKSGTKLRYFF
jgi:hypothetical protein